MKVLFFGQATGGNASLWFEFLSKQAVAGNVMIHFLARTVCTLTSQFKVYKPYGTSVKYKRIRNLFASKVMNPLYVYILSKMYAYDLVVLQGNYTPKENLRVIRSFTGRKILNIYGSDFYRKYLLQEFSSTDRMVFEMVMAEVDAIYCNWDTTLNDVMASFPQHASKMYVSPWGVADKRWFEKPKPKKELTFLSTRALHVYNNVDVVVEAFCRVFAGVKEATLVVIGAYGNDPVVIKNINNIISKYNADTQVKLHLDSWFEGQALVDMYDAAKYNICFGSTDQLTLSIPYGYLRGCVNVLSPLENYRCLSDKGFKSQLLASDFSVNALEEVFRRLEYSGDCTVEADSLLARNVFDLSATFASYLSTVN